MQSAVPENDLDRLSALVQLADPLQRAADLDARVLQALEDLLACECVLLQPGELVHALGVPVEEFLVQVAAPDGEIAVTLSLRRPLNRPFGERELVLLELLRPRLVDWLAGRLVGRERCPSDGLTARQIEILRLAQLGMANKEIARGLRISVATVRKHLEHAYERLGAGSRTGAVSAAFGPEHPRREG